MGLLAAFIAALAYGAATILQAVSVDRLAAAGRAASWKVRIRLFAPYAAGLAIDGVGFLAAVIAVRTEPLFVVQSIVASSVAVTALLAVLFLRERLRGTEIGALVVMVAGLGLLSASALEGPARPVSRLGHLLVLSGVVLVALVFGGGLLCRRRRPAAPLLAAASGLGFGGVAIAARILPTPHPWWRILVTVDAWSVCLYGAIAITAYGLALDRGSATQVAAVTFAIETIVPSMLGLAWLGDRVRPGWGYGCAVGFVLTLAACVALARRAEPAVAGDLTSGDPPASTV